MLNVIVYTGLENAPNGRIWSARMFQYTEDAHIAMVDSAGARRNDLLRSYPTLIMEEGTGDERAGFGWLTKIQASGRDTEFEFVLDPIFPQLTNSQIVELAADFKLSDFEFRTNHWAIKNVDLFEVLYRRGLGAALRPTVFNVGGRPVNPKLVSFMMPFSAPMDRVYQGLAAALTPLGYTCQRADNIWVHDAIIQDIVYLIESSSVVICDLSGRNANVFTRPELLMQWASRWSLLLRTTRTFRLISDIFDLFLTSTTIRA